MGGLNTSLSIGTQALEAAQGALTATSNNIANANTPGYTREVSLLAENQELQIGSNIVGGGVSLAGLQSVRDELLNLQIQSQTSLQSGADTQLSLLQEIQAYFTTNGGDIASTFAAFSSSLAQLSANPADSSVQQSVLTSGENLAQAFSATASGLTGIQTTADSQVTQITAQINALVGQIAQLNGQVTQLTATGKDGGTAQDQRDELVQQLAQLTGISVMSGSEGETITTGNGTPLVIGNRSFLLQTAVGPDGMQHLLDANGNDITGFIQGGQLGGAIQVRDQTIPDILTQLNTLASQFAASFNAAQAQGFDSNGNPGQNFFTAPANDAAAGMSVAISDPSLIAVSSDGSAGSNGNVSKLSAVLTDALPSGQTPGQSYANLVEQVGSAASDASTQATAIGQHLQQLQSQKGAISAVNIDEETTNMIRFQTAYQAAARIVSTIQKLNADTINMIS